MQNFTAKDNNIVTILEELLETLPKLVSNKSTNEKIVDQNEWASFSDQIKKLNAALINYSDPLFSYEFYETAADLITEISNRRLDTAWRTAISPNGLTLINHLVATIKKAIYRHEVLRESIYQDESPISPSMDPIEAAKIKIDRASEKTTAAALAAEKANEAADDFLQEIQEEQDRSGGLLEPASIERSIKVTLELSARNAAAVLAADANAEAIAEYEDLLRNK